MHLNGDVLIQLTLLYKFALRAKGQYTDVVMDILQTEGKCMHYMPETNAILPECTNLAMYKSWCNYMNYFVTHLRETAINNLC